MLRDSRRDSIRCICWGLRAHDLGSDSDPSNLWFGWFILIIAQCRETESSRARELESSIRVELTWASWCESSSYIAQIRRIILSIAPDSTIAYTRLANALFFSFSINPPSHTLTVQLGDIHSFHTPNVFTTVLLIQLLNLIVAAFACWAQQAILDKCPTNVVGTVVK